MVRLGKLSNRLGVVSQPVWWGLVWQIQEQATGHALSRGVLHHSHNIIVHGKQVLCMAEMCSARNNIVTKCVLCASTAILNSVSSSERSTLG